MSYHESDGAKKKTDGTYNGKTGHPIEVRDLGERNGFEYRQARSRKPWTKRSPQEGPLPLEVGSLIPS